jgi:cyclohexyl-isocyanide hydratase
MKVGFLIYSDATEVEYVTAQECLSKVYQLGIPNPPECHIIGLTPEVIGWNGIIIKPHHHYPDVDLKDYDLLVIPGGLTSRVVRYDKPFMTWLKMWDGDKSIASICSGALILGEAGFLRGKRATTHVLAMGTLAPYCREVVKSRVVEDGNVITAGGIMAGMELGLYLVEKFYGPDVRRRVAHQCEYRDVEKHPEYKRLVAELDTWYAGGHGRISRRPASWVAPPPDNLIERETTDYLPNTS